MNDLLSEALNLWHRGQVLQAEKILVELSKSNEAKEEQEEILLALISISIYQKDFISLQKYFAKLCLLKQEKRDWASLEKLINELVIESSYIKNNMQRMTLKTLGLCAFHNGKIEKANNLWNSYWQKLIKHKLTDELESSLKELQSPQNENLTMIHLQGNILSKKRKDYALNLKKYFNFKQLEKQKIEDLIALIDLEGLVYSEYRDLLDVYAGRPIKSKKDVMKLINIIINFYSPELHWQAVKQLNYSERYGAANLMLNLLKINAKKFYKELEKSKRSQLKKIVEHKKIEQNFIIDFEGSLDYEMKLEVLKQKLNFHKHYGEVKEIEQTVRIIKQIDPYFTEESELSEELSLESALVTTNKITEESIQNLISEITYYANQGNKNEEKLEEVEQRLKKIIEVNLKEIEDENICDYVVMLNSFGFHDLALIMVDKWKAINSDFEKKYEKYLEISYLEIITKFEMKKHFENLSALKIINSKFPLKQEEKVCFLYLEAETYYELKMFKQALPIYQMINKIAYGYRLTNNRLREIEKN